MSLAVDIYELTRPFPREEMFGMTSQMRRASLSIAANIAEGYGRQQTKPFIQFLRVSQGSLKELETLLLLAGQVGLVAGEATENPVSAHRQDARWPYPKAGLEGRSAMNAVSTIHHSPFTIHVTRRAAA